MVDEAEFSGLIASVYDAAVDATLWPGVIANVVAATRANAAGFVSCDLAEGRAEIVPVGFDARAAESYNAYYSRVDWFLPAVVAGTPGEAVRGRMLKPAAELQRTEVYTDWAVPNGVVEAAAVLIERSSDHIAAIAVARPRADHEFERNELDLLTRLAPHLRRAFGVQRRLAAAWGQEAALDRLQHGVMLVGRDARVLFANRAAEALLQANVLRTERGALAAPRKAETAALHALIAGEGGALTALRAGGLPLVVTVVPMRHAAPWLAGRQPAAIVFIADAGTDALPLAQRLQALFGLTPAQAALAREIARGDGLDAAAARLGVTRATARTHLAQLFAKTRTRRQAELVRLLLQVGPGLRES